MKLKKIPAPERAGTESMVQEFARLATELARMNPKRLAQFGRRILAAEKRGARGKTKRRVTSRSSFPNKTS